MSPVAFGSQKYNGDSVAGRIAPGEYAVLVPNKTKRYPWSIRLCRGSLPHARQSFALVKADGKRLVRCLPNGTTIVAVD